MISDEWLPVIGWEGLYEVSSTGLLASLPRSRRNYRMMVKGFVNQGYLYAILASGKRKETRRVHHLVCEAFNGHRPAGAQTRHLDGNSLNNAASNLAWGTNSENQRDIVRHGRNSNAVKTTCPQGHSLFGDNLYIIPSTLARVCRKCQRAARMRYYARSGK